MRDSCYSGKNVVIMLEFINLTTISFALMAIGAIGVALLKKPLDKVIMLSVLEAGFFLAIVTFKYLDVTVDLFDFLLKDEE